MNTGMRAVVTDTRQGEGNPAPDPEIGPQPQSPRVKVVHAEIYEAHGPCEGCGAAVGREAHVTHTFVRDEARGVTVQVPGVWCATCCIVCSENKGGEEVRG